MYYSSKLSLLKFLHSSCHIYLVCDYEKIFCRLIFKNISNCENISKAPLAKYINKVPLFTPPFDFSLWNNQLFTIIQDKQPLWLMFSFSIIAHKNLKAFQILFCSLFMKQLWNKIYYTKRNFLEWLLLMTNWWNIYLSLSCLLLNYRMMTNFLQISRAWLSWKLFYLDDAQWSRKPKSVQKFRITLFWHVVGLRDVNFTKMW